jgi:hypothetical protein
VGEVPGQARRLGGACGPVVGTDTVQDKAAGAGGSCRSESLGRDATALRNLEQRRRRDRQLAQLMLQAARQIMNKQM